MTDFPWQLVKALQDQQREALEAQDLAHPRSDDLSLSAPVVLGG
jgi:hypothetical protein